MEPAGGDARATGGLCRQGRRPMLRHKASCLSGPVSKTRRSWTQGLDKPRTPRDESAIRTDLVERVRREIAEGTYETPEKLDIALERLLNRLEWE
jgi:hypothetical protein